MHFSRDPEFRGPPRVRKERERDSRSDPTHRYSIRDAYTESLVVDQTYSNVLLALEVAQGLANRDRARLEIVREDGSVVVAVDPEAP